MNQGYFYISPSSMEPIFFRTQSEAESAARLYLGEEDINGETITEITVCSYSVIGNVVSGGFSERIRKVLEGEAEDV